MHGPLQAALLLNYARQLAGGRTPTTFSFRGVSPLIQGSPFHLNAGDDQYGMALWASDCDGVTTMTAQASWQP